MRRPSAVTNSLPPPRSMLSVSQTNSTSLVADRKRPSDGSVSARSTACGLGLTCLRRTRAAAGCFEGDVAARLRERNERDPAIVGFCARNQIVDGAHAHLPGPSRREAVVDQERQRRLGSRGGDRRIPQRACGGDDHECSEHQPQQRQPPRRALRRFLLGRDVEQQSRGREIDAARLRRNKPQQPPQHRQAQQPEQHQGLRETERKPRHHRGLPVMSALRARPLTPRREAARPGAHAAQAAIRSPAGRCDEC